MTEIERKALALLNEFSDYEVPDLDEAQYSTAIQALCRAIEQHEQFKREVSDAVEAYCGYVPPDGPSHPITRFILPKPVDPLVEVAEELRETYCATGADWAKATRAALAKHGLEIREVE